MTDVYALFKKSVKKISNIHVQNEGGVKGRLNYVKNNYTIGGRGLPLDRPLSIPKHPPTITTFSSEPGDLHLAKPCLRQDGSAKQGEGVATVSLYSQSHQAN